MRSCFSPQFVFQTKLSYSMLVPSSVLLLLPMLVPLENQHSAIWAMFREFSCWQIKLATPCKVGLALHIVSDKVIYQVVVYPLIYRYLPRSKASARPRSLKRFKGGGFILRVAKVASLLQKKFAWGVVKPYYACPLPGHLSAKVSLQKKRGMYKIKNF